MTIGERIKTLRRKNDLTQEKLAEYLSVSSQAVSKWECGLACPDLSLIMPLSKILRVTADELLGGNDAENDARRAEYDERLKTFWKYDKEENYQMASQAVSEFPREYKYLVWRAETECSCAMYDSSIRHSETVIEDCTDTELRNRAIWNAMMCSKRLERYDEARRFAEMLPKKTVITRGKAMRRCLEGVELEQHNQLMVYDALRELIFACREIYAFAEEKTPQVISALDTAEAVIKAVISDGNYLAFHTDLCFIYEKRAMLELHEGNCDRAMEYLRIVMDHAEKYMTLCDGGTHSYTCGIFSLLSKRLNSDASARPYLILGDRNNSLTMLEKIKAELMTEEIYAPLREREDFRRLMEGIE